MTMVPFRGGTAAAVETMGGRIEAVLAGLGKVSNQGSAAPAGGEHRAYAAASRGADHPRSRHRHDGRRLEAPVGGRAPIWARITEPDRRDIVAYIRSLPAQAL
jgi:hypothetical protein